jgi:tetratricopeptide (TPR) repeat protein
VAAVLAVGCASSGNKKTTETPVSAGPAPSPDHVDLLKDEKHEAQKPGEELFDAAVERASKLLDGNPTDSACKQAADQFDDAIGKNPKMVAAYYNQGLAYERCNLEKDAERAYRKALDINSKYSNALGGLGVVAWKAGRKEEAERYFRQALSIDQRCLPALVNMATMLRERAQRTGDMSAVKEAQDDVRRALAVDGDNMAAYATLALIYYDLAGSDRAKLDMADTVLTQAKRKNDKYAPIWNISGLVQLRKKNVTQALRAFRKAIELDPNMVAANMNIGAVTLSFRDYASAEQSFKTVLKKEPQNIDAIIGLGVAYRGQKKIKEAEEQYLAAAKLDPRNCAVPFDLGLLYQDYMSGAEGELRKAQQYYRDFQMHCPNDRDRIAEADRRTKNIDETFRALAEAKAIEAEAKRLQEQQDLQQRRMEEKQKREQEEKEQQKPTPKPAGDDADKPPTPAPPAAPK